MIVICTNYKNAPIIYNNYKSALTNYSAQILDLNAQTINLSSLGSIETIRTDTAILINILNSIQTYMLSHCMGPTTSRPELGQPHAILGNMKRTTHTFNMPKPVYWTILANWKAGHIQISIMASFWMIEQHPHEIFGQMQVYANWNTSSSIFRQI